ncbi:MAG: flagellar hook-length control protein FliK [Pirellulaceae bacterium]|nr:flagellar hook-length control protein FliK [Pirellulaceae bacterium]
MTRVPATANDSQLQAILKGSDHRRTAALATSNSDFYQTLLATAPINDFGKFASSLSLEYLAPALTTPESSSRRDPREDEDRRPVPTNDTDPANRDTAAPETERDGAISEPKHSHVKQRFPEAALAVEPAAPSIADPFSQIIRRDNLDLRPATDLRRDKLAAAVEASRPEPSLLGLADKPEKVRIPNVQPSEVEAVTQVPPDQVAVAIPLEPAVRSEGFPSADRVAKQILETRAADPAAVSETHEQTVGKISLDNPDWKAVPAAEAAVELTPAATAAARKVLEGKSDLTASKEVYERAPVPVADSLLNPRIRETAVDEPQQKTRIEPVLVTTENSAVAVDAEETVEISFKADAPVVQKSDRFVTRGNRRSSFRDEGLDAAIGNRPGAQEPSDAIYARPERPANLKLAGDAANYSLDEIPFLPSAQRVVAQSSIVAMAAAGLRATAHASEIALELPGRLDGSFPATNQTLSASTATPTVGSSPWVTRAFSAEDATAVEGQVAGTDRTPVPSRLLNQVAHALKQVPAGDSTMRLQLNPMELGQLMIEISFRDGVMHGRLRAEQGPTLRMLQEGLEGLRTRLSDQGIVVQTLEVELGQQGDFTQQHQHRSSSQSQEFGQQRQSNGYFTGEGQPVRRSKPDKQPDITPTSTHIDGRWAVNVVI